MAGKDHVYPLSWTGMGKVSSFIALIKAIREFAPDVISINRERDVARVYLCAKVAALFMPKKPKIVSVFHNIGRKTSRFVMDRLDGMLFPNRYLMDHYLAKGQERGVPSVVVYHGIELPAVDLEKKLDPKRDRRFFTGAAFPVIGMVGELRKNQIELVDVAFELKKKLDGFTIAVIGRGTVDEVAILQQKIDRLGLTKHFILTGNVDRSRIPDIFFDLDISVTTNRQEPFGIVFLESLATATPLVAYDSGGPVEIIQKGGGSLVTGGPAEMVGELHRLITDHEARKAMARAGRAAAEKHFSIDAMGEGHLGFYEGICEAI
jgi:glycosyltransferase involved in cell wall biosynthesis